MKILPILAVILLAQNVTIYDENGNFKGRVGSNGFIYDVDGNYSGRLKDGFIYDANGNYDGMYVTEDEQTEGNEKIEPY